jgi:glycosyltransferase involved in cell wall biosynthesis
VVKIINKLIISNNDLLMPVADKVTSVELATEGSQVLQARIPISPPKIAVIPENTIRPLWSVMIPVYNCLPYLQETLESVLVQAAGSKDMQIAVIDDCSTDGDVRTLVQTIGGGRIEYFRQPSNQGSLRNFETCLNRSKGHRVHILHGDDRVMPGFYTEIDMLFTCFPEVGAAFTNLAHITGNSEVIYKSDNLLDKPGVLKDFLVQNAQKLLVQPPAIVVKRSVYEQLGGFYGVHYGEDWEMWTRIAAHFPIAYSPKCLANYRYYTSNSITQRSILNGQNIRDIMKIIDVMQVYLPETERARVKNIARREYALYCVSMANSLFRTNWSAAMIQAKGALELSKDIKVYKLFAKYFVSSVLGYGKLKKELKNLFASPK